MRFQKISIPTPWKVNGKGWGGGVKNLKGRSCPCEIIFPEGHAKLAIIELSTYKLGYLKDRNAAAHSVDTGIS